MLIKPEILVCPPTYYTVDYEINPWMDIKDQPDSTKAQNQWLRMVNYYQNLSLKIHQIKPLPKLPDMVFTANAGLICGNNFIASNFRHPQRQPEKELFINWFKKKNFKVHQLSSEYFFEGQGDALFVNDVLFAGYRFRSDIQTHQQISQIINREVISLELVNSEFYHLDTCFCPLGDNAALYYPGAFDEYGNKVIKNMIPNLIPVSENDARKFCCNAMVIDKKIIANEMSKTLRNQLSNSGFKIIEMGTDNFMKAGGSIKCMSLIINI